VRRPGANPCPREPGYFQPGETSASVRGSWSGGRNDRPKGPGEAKGTTVGRPLVGKYSLERTLKKLASTKDVISDKRTHYSRSEGEARAKLGEY